MPTYIFKNKDNGEITEIQMRISDLDQFKQSNPNLSLKDRFKALGRPLFNQAPLRHNEICGT